LLDLSDLKKWLHRDSSAEDKLLAVLATFEVGCQVKDIKVRATEAGFLIPKNWNISQILGRSQGKAIRTPTGWEIGELGEERLVEIGILGKNPAVERVAVELRAYINRIKDEDTRRFLSEAVHCYEFKLYRSAIVMSWLGAVAILQRKVVEDHLAEFNAEATRRKNNKWKVAKSADDLGLMQEREFLDVLQSLSIIGKNVKSELVHCLDRRNSCGHPNSFKLSENVVAAHVETLMLNVYTRFS
tara:strand:+ start:2356 stop:3084 length:729 start_codon:yes stop_codon:yes gene_type:complete